ncbi:hypothetical protein A6B43_01725 [Vespertiliibacter pulmonis]|uniref:Outer membrane transport energization protein TonB n=1 Tax=Vespertiliibacter pulmonis TaxID=1443036 RepID=A0A3N4VYT5_9PAST|nr:energy transducer TonB [Vespertiliibacter pulmonis]QLB20349.1 hypothetical protein A6B43_01725 [Vespertiliibacter pulmonis]RPE86335.1 outer membrane transport energization protein TonB [Vespertiliibacter pulmonis]
MIKHYPLIGTIISLLFHSALFSGVWWTINHSQPKNINEELTTISMEMMTAVLEQSEVVEPIPVKEEQFEEQEKEPDPIVKPVKKPKIKPIEKPKPIEKLKPKPIEKIKPKPIEKPKTQAKKENSLPNPLTKPTEIKASVVAKHTLNPAPVEKAQTTATLPTTQRNNNDEIKAAYTAKLHRILYKRINDAYPKNRNRGITGTVMFKISLSPTGQITNIVLVKPSGNSRLDNASTKAAQQTTQVDPPPKDFPSNFTVPINFGYK